MENKLVLTILRTYLNNFDLSVSGSVGKTKDGQTFNFVISSKAKGESKTQEPESK